LSKNSIDRRACALEHNTPVDDDDDDDGTDQQQWLLVHLPTRRSARKHTNAVQRGVVHA